MDADAWLVDQYAYFWVAGETITSEQLTARLGLLPDQVMERGSKKQDPPRPPESSWKIVSDRPGRMEQQITQLLDRVRPVAARVRELVDSGEASAGLTLIRHFDDDRGIPEALGWWLEPKQVELLAAMSASIQSDEYGG